MRIDVITALPELLTSPLDHSIVGRARSKEIVEIVVHDLRDYTLDRHRKIDDYPFGGGAGMVMTPEPIFRCVEAILEEGGPVDEIIFLTPDGTTFDQPIANQLSMSKRLILIAGHYKGIDQRVRDTLVTKEVSIGDFVLSGGELPAAVLIDAVVRLVPGVLSDATSALSDSFQDGLLGAPAYTRPADFRGNKVPEVLLSGDHARIAKWTEQQRISKTRDRRPDILDSGTADREE